MRVVKTADITEAVRRLCIEANLSLSDDVRAAVNHAGIIARLFPIQSRIE